MSCKNERNGKCILGRQIGFGCDPDCPDRVPMVIEQGDIINNSITDNNSLINKASINNEDNENVESIKCLSGAQLDNISIVIPKRTHKYYQDSSFKLLFKDEKYQRMFLQEMYSDVNWDNVELKNIELEQVFYTDIHNDVCFRADEQLFVLMEHQSSVNWNMPLRMLLYVAEEYKRVFKNNKLNSILFQENLFKIPSPQFYVVYTGEDPWRENELKLSDSYLGDFPVMLDLKITILTENSSVGVAQDYAAMIGKIKRLRKSNVQLNRAIEVVLREYAFGHKISGFVQRGDIMGVLNEQFTEEDYIRAVVEANVLAERQKTLAERQKTQEAIRRAEEEKRKAEEEKRKAEEEKRRAEEEKRKAEEEKRKAISNLMVKLNISEEKAREILGFN